MVPTAHNTRSDGVGGGSTPAATGAPPPPTHWAGGAPGGPGAGGSAVFARRPQAVAPQAPSAATSVYLGGGGGGLGGSNLRPRASSGRLSVDGGAPRAVEFICMVALVVVMLLFGLLAFHTPGLPSVRHTHASASSAYDRAMYVPGSARRKKGSAADGWVDESSGMMSQVLGGGAQISSTHRPNKYLQTRQKETEAAMDFMTELEERTRRAMMATVANSNAEANRADREERKRADAYKHQGGRAGDPCSPLALTAHESVEARVAHCERHGVHIAAHCPAACFGFAAAAVDEAHQDQVASGDPLVWVDEAMAKEAITRAETGVVTCVDFDTARCFQAASAHSCTGLQKEGDEWYGTHAMSLMCPRTCTWVLLSDSLPFAEAYFRAHNCHLSPSGETMDAKRFEKVTMMEMANKIHRGGDIDPRFQMERARLSVGLAPGWEVKKDARSGKAFYSPTADNDAPGTFKRPPGSQPETSKEAFDAALKANAAAKGASHHAKSAHARVVDSMRRAEQQRQANMAAKSTAEQAAKGGADAGTGGATGAQ